MNNLVRLLSLSNGKCPILVSCNPRIKCKDDATRWLFYIYTEGKAVLLYKRYVRMEDTISHCSLAMNTRIDSTSYAL
jgi:hypothetical protein